MMFFSSGLYVLTEKSLLLMKVLSIVCQRLSACVEVRIYAIYRALNHKPCRTESEQYGTNSSSLGGNKTTPQEHSTRTFSVVPTYLRELTQHHYVDIPRFSASR